MKINKTKFIAEIGVNHNGSIKIAKRLIDEAVKVGADYVKFQVYKTDLLVAKKALFSNLKNLTLNLVLEKNSGK